MTLQTKNLSKHFDGVQAVEDLSLTIAAGKLTGIIGPNGSGKTTLTHLLTGIQPISAGAVVIGERTYYRIQSRVIARLGLTRTFQDVRLFEQMSARDNVLVVLTKRGVFAALFGRHSYEHEQTAEAVLRRVGLWEKRAALAGELSYGQRKLLEIARILAMDAKIILFDEPFSGLFKEMIGQVVEIIKELRAAGKTIVLIEHNMELIRQLSDYIIVMDAGKLLAEGKPEEVLGRPEVIEAYLGE